MKKDALNTRIRKGDLVRVITGKEKGKEGNVLSVSPAKQAVFVEGLNLFKRATKASQGNPKGGFVEREGRLHLSNVMLLCASCGKLARIGAKILPDGKKLRICRRCEEVLDKNA